MLRTLGTGGSCKVKLGVDNETGQKVAIKILDRYITEYETKLVLTETNALINLKHLNIIGLIESGRASYVKISGKTKTISYIVLELALVGQIFDIIVKTGRFSEEMARYYFR